MNVGNCSNPLIPVDIIFQISLRLPAKSLLRLRCVCKIWCNIIDSVLFANIHFSERLAADDAPQILALPSQIRPGEALPSSIYNNDVIKKSAFPILELSADEDDGQLNIVFYVGYGLLWFRNRKGENFLCNPLRGEVLELPTGNVAAENYSDCYGMGVDSTTNTYKIVRVVRVRESTDPFSYKMKTEVYSLGTSSWRAIPSVPPCGLCLKGVSASGDMHWLSSNHCSPRNAHQIKIISFNFRKEEFKETPHPDFGVYKNFGKFMLVNLKGSLAIVKFSRDPSAAVDIEIWVLKDYDKKEWVSECRMSGLRINQDIACWVDGLYIYTNWGLKLYLFDLKTNCSWQMHRPGTKRFNGITLDYRESVLSLKNFGNTFKVAEDERCNFLKTARLVNIS